MPERPTFASVATPLESVATEPAGEPLSVKLTVFPLSAEPPEVSVAVSVALPLKTPLPETLEINVGEGVGVGVGVGEGLGVGVGVGEQGEGPTLSGVRRKASTCPEGAMPVPAIWPRSLTARAS